MREVDACALCGEFPEGKLVDAVWFDPHPLLPPDACSRRRAWICEDCYVVLWAEKVK